MTLKKKGHCSMSFGQESGKDTRGEKKTASTWPSLVVARSSCKVACSKVKLMSSQRPQTADRSPSVNATSAQRKQLQGIPAHLTALRFIQAPQTSYSGVSQSSGRLPTAQRTSWLS